MSNSSILTHHTKLKSVSGSRRCEVCDGDHKCSYGADGVIMCGRRRGDQPGFICFGAAPNDPQWEIYRREGDTRRGEHAPRYQPACHRPSTPPAPATDWHKLTTLHDYYARQVPADCLDRVAELAAGLGVAVESLEALRIGWSDEEQCWTCPELDAAGKIVGITRRWRDGTKKAMAGGHRGLCYPADLGERIAAAGLVLIVEGASDTAAGLTLGIPTVGRPSATGGAEMLADLLAAINCRVIILGENDRKETGDWPGRDGAQRVAVDLGQRLGRDVAVVMPPDGVKDLRAWLSRPDARREVLALIDPKPEPYPERDPASERRPMHLRCQRRVRVPFLGKTKTIPCGCWKCVGACDEMLRAKNMAHLDQLLQPHDTLYVMEIPNDNATAIDRQTARAVAAANKASKADFEDEAKRLGAEAASLDARGQRQAAEALRERAALLTAAALRPVHGYVKIRPYADGSRYMITSVFVAGALLVSRDQAAELAAELLNRCGVESGRGPVNYSRSWKLPPRPKGPDEVTGIPLPREVPDSVITAAYQAEGRFLGFAKGTWEWEVIGHSLEARRRDAREVSRRVYDRVQHFVTGNPVRRE